MKTQFVVTAVGVALALQGCSSKPRDFDPKLAAVPADQAAFETAHSECRQLLADGKLNSHGQLASTGAGAAAGATTAAVGGAAAATTGGLGGFALASATVVALPFAMIGGGWWMAKSKKNKKERKLQEATAGCLSERGFAIVGWEPSSKKKRNSSLVKQAASKPAS